MSENPLKTEAEWKQTLSSEEYRILREKGTEAPYTGEYWNTRDPGTYVCRACGQELFDAATKFDAGCGWPSFYTAAAADRVTLTEDLSHGMTRTEVSCSNCGSHLGHLFDDGPEPTGKRFCINSISLKLNKVIEE